MILNKKISMIYASTKNGLIGDCFGNLPWKCSADMNHFKEKTLGKSVILGRRTFESIGKPLLNRDNIVLTSKNIPGVKVARSLEDAVQQAEEEVVVIGGAQVYKSFLPKADLIWRTILDLDLVKENGTYFSPNINTFKVISREEISSDGISGVIEELVRYEAS